MNVYEQRFWAKVNKTEGCWLWTGASNEHGYGMLRINGKAIKAHRFSAMLHFGMFDKRLNVCHSCDEPNCIRPDHLFLGSQSDNMRDCLNKGRLALPYPHRNAAKTECPNGHVYDEENTIVDKAWAWDELPGWL